MSHFSFSLISEIKAQASRTIVQIADALLLHEYPHKARCAGGYEYGRKRGKRSWTVTETGKYAGWAKHWSEGKNLDAVGLVQHRTGSSFPEALAWLASFLGIETDTAPLDPATIRQAQQDREAKERAEQTRRNRKQEQADSEARRRALSFLSNCLPATGTPAERYLTEHRGLTIPEGGWPSCIRWHEKAACLVAVLSDEAGKALTGQRISLTRNTAARREGSDGKPEAKRLLKGPRPGLFMRLEALPRPLLPDTIRKPLILSEGPETALSLWQATGVETWATIGAGGKVPVSGARLIILARDDDQPGSPADKRADDLKTALQEQGHIVVDCWPHATRQGDKSDFNDLLISEGQQAILDRVAASLSGLPAPRPSLAKAQKELQAIISDWMAKHYGKPSISPAALLVPVEVGVGKSHTARQMAIQHYDSEKGPIIWAVPHHDLAEQAAKDWQEAAPGLTVTVWKGRDHEGMCANIEGRKTVSDAGLSVTKHLCRKTNQPCPFAKGCPYLKQLEARADVWIITHAMLPITKPGNILSPSLLIIDEDFTPTGLFGLKGSSNGTASLSLPKEFEKERSDWSGQEITNRASRARCALELAEHNGATHVTREAIEAYSFRAKTMAEGITETGNAISCIEGKCHTLKDIQYWGPTLRSLRHLIGVLKEFSRVLSEGLEASGRIPLSRTEKGGPQYRLRGIRPVHESWKAPTLLLDATANPDTIRPYFPDVEIAKTIRAASPYAKFSHVQNLTWGKIAQGAACKNWREGQRNIGQSSIERIRLIAWDRYLQHGKGGLIIANKETVGVLRQTYLPPGTDALHFGKLVGLNAYQNVAWVEIFGRPLMLAKDAEAWAETITGHPMTETVPRLDRRDVERPGEPGRTCLEYHHPDPLAKGIIRQVINGGLIQAAGRARAVRRGENSPVIIRLHSDVYPADMPLDHIEKATPPSALARQLAGEQGTMPALMSARDAYICRPDLWLSHEAAKKDMQRKKAQFCAASSDFVPKGTNPFNNISKEECPFGYKLPTAPEKLPFLPIRSVSYRPAGSQEKWRQSLVPSDWSDDAFRDWLTDRLKVPMELQGDPPPIPTRADMPITAPPPAPASLQELVTVFDRAISDKEKGNVPFNGVDMALVGKGKSPTEMAQCLAWGFLSQDLTEKGEAARRAILESPLARRIAPYLSDSGDSLSGMAVLEGMKVSGWRP